MAKVRITVTMEPDMLRRVDRLARTAQRSRSQMLELLLKDAVEDTELAAKVFTDPNLGPGLARIVSDRDFLRGVSSALGDELSDDQLRLFRDKLSGMVTPSPEESGRSRKRGRGKS